jgi:hypothetical protein
MQNNKINLILVFILFLVLSLIVGWSRINNHGQTAVVKLVSAQELTDMFFCPCCNKVVTECGCSMAAERKAFVDGVVQAGIDKDSAIMAYIKRYGLEFIEESKKEEFRQKLIERAPASRPIIEISPQSFDFGEVSQKEGVAETVFEIKNNGQSDLVIDKLETSCGCTSASIIYQGREGPKFTMPGHGVSEEMKDWRVIIPPADIAYLKVYYDPAVHPDFRGDVIREIYIFSNDPVDFQKKVSVELKQVD